jgi:hypothetical protein
LMADQDLPETKGLYQSVIRALGIVQSGKHQRTRPAIFLLNQCRYLHVCRRSPGLHWLGRL